MEPVKVAVRAFGDEARVVWAVSRRGDIVYVTDNEGFNDILDGSEPARMPAVMAYDVYALSDGLQTGDNPEWEKMTPFVSLAG